MAQVNRLRKDEAKNSFSELKRRCRSLQNSIFYLDALKAKLVHDHMIASRLGSNPQRMELEAVKFLHQLIQESEDEPTKQAIKLYLTLKNLRSQGQENSVSYQVASRAMENIIYQHGLDIDGLTGYVCANASQRKQEAKESAFGIVSKAAQVYKAISCASGLQQAELEIPRSAIYLSPERESPAYEMTASKAFDQEGANRILNNAKETTQDNGSSQTREMNQMMRHDPSFQQSDMASIGQEGTPGSPKNGMDNSSAKGTFDVKSLSKIQNSRLKVTTPVPPSQQQIMVVNNMSRGNVVGMERDIATHPRNRVTARTLDQEYGINRAVLEHHSGKKLEDVADILGISRSTLKRICRKHHIFRWPPCKAKKDKRSLQKLVQATQRNISGRNHRSSELSAPQAQMISDAKIVGGDGRVMVKATYRDDIFKFQLSLSSTKLDLEKEISLRLKLSVGSFKTKYLDEDNDWISVACDADLRTCIMTLTSLGRATIKMLVDQI